MGLGFSRAAQQAEGPTPAVGAANAPAVSAVPTTTVASSSSAAGKAAAAAPKARGAADTGLPPVPEHCTLELRRRIKWGVATASYQIEGAWNEGGRSPSIWDTFSHTPGVTQEGATGDVACDHYHRYKEDIALMASLGIKHYRFSFSWSRLLPDGAAGTKVNPEGLAFYNDLIDSMLAAGVQPYATQFHWDLPQVLSDRYDGFLGGDAFVADFVYYASTLFGAFGDRVKHWMTFNEPWVMCAMGYGSGEFAPGVAHGDGGQYLAGHTLLRAHAAVAELYATRFKPTQRGRLGVALNTFWHEPQTQAPADAAAAGYALEQDLGWFAGPLYRGEYPAVVKATKPVPDFTEEDRVRLLTYPPDFFGLNFYSASYVESDGTEYGYKQTPFAADGTPIGPQAQSSWLRVVPWGLYKLLQYIQRQYLAPDAPTAPSQPGAAQSAGAAAAALRGTDGAPAASAREIFITENGCSAPGEAGMEVGEAVRDAFRVGFYAEYLDAMCRAVQEGVNVSHYFAWSFMDNFEWRQGYTERFGIVAVDFREDLSRSVKDSGAWLSDHFFKVGA